MPNLKEQPMLKDFQQYVKEIVNERGFNGESKIQKCLMLGEEVGELFKAVRKAENIKIDQNSKVDSVENELSDVLIFLLEIANMYNIDLEKAFRAKEAINSKRIWN